MFGYLYGWDKISGKPFLSSDIPGGRLPSPPETMPKLFRQSLYLPERTPRNTGILLMQKFKNLGGKTSFEKGLQEYLYQEVNEKFTLKLNPIVSHELLEKILDADELIELQLINRATPKEITSKIIGEDREFKEKRVLSLHSTDDSLKEKLKGLFGNLRNEEKSYIEIDGEEYDPKLVIEEGGSQSTLDFEGFKFRESKKLEEDKLELDGGHPTQESILDHSIEYMNHLLEEHDDDVFIEDCIGIY